jgi:hypothetical protein
LNVFLERRSGFPREGEVLHSAHHTTASLFVIVCIVNGYFFVLLEIDRFKGVCVLFVDVKFLRNRKLLSSYLTPVQTFEEVMLLYIIDVPVSESLHWIPLKQFAD